MGRLTDILRTGAAESLREAWDSTEAAGDMGPLPTGEYTAHVVAGALETLKTNATPGYRLTFRVCEGDFTGRLRLEVRKVL